jgi:hypothetical protein
VAPVLYVTSTVAGEPEPIAVWTLPAISATENADARVSVLDRRSPTVALDVAAIVHTVPEVWETDVIVAMFVSVKSAPVTLDSVVQSIASLPVSVNEIVVLEDVADDAARVKVGAVVSMTMALAPAMLLAPDGTVVDVIALPAVSAIVPIVKLDTVRSDELCPDPTVYVPVSVVPADAAVSSTVAPVSSVAVSVLPAWTASLVVAVMFTVRPTPYVPSAVDDENAVTVGAVESIVTESALDVDVTTVSRAVDATAVSECAPALSVPVVHDHAPVVSFARHVLPVSAPPSFNWTDAPGAADPVKVSAVLVVRSSLFDAPVSEPAAKSGTDTAGRVYRTTTMPALAVPPAPATDCPLSPAPPPPPPP